MHTTLRNFFLLSPSSSHSFRIVKDDFLSSSSSIFLWLVSVALYSGCCLLSLKRLFLNAVLDLITPLELARLRQFPLIGYTVHFPLITWTQLIILLSFLTSILPVFFLSTSVFPYFIYTPFPFHSQVAYYMDTVADPPTFPYIHPAHFVFIYISSPLFYLYSLSLSFTSSLLHASSYLSLHPSLPASLSLPLPRPLPHAAAGSRGLRGVQAWGALMPDMLGADGLLVLNVC